MSLDRRRVDQHLRRRTARRCHRMEDVFSNAFGRPAHEAIVKRLTWAVDGGGVNPATPGLQHMNDATDDPAVVDPWLASRIGWKMRFKPRELAVIQPETVSIHQRSPFGDLESRNAHFGNLEGSVRSRGEEAAAARGRDLIEAGLN